MSSIKCPRCGITNFSTAVHCKRCNTALASGTRSKDSYQAPNARAITDDVTTASTNELAPPRTLGILLTVLGAVLSVAGVYLLVSGSTPFFLVAGIGIAPSGVLIAVGKRAGMYLYFATLAMMFVWSLIETGGDVGQMMIRMGVVALIGIYLMTEKVRSRLH